MAFIEDLLKSESTTGLAIGIGAAILVPVILPAVAALARPIARAAIKTGIIAYEKGREAIAEMGEVVEDLVAEARADIQEGHIAGVAAAVAGTAGDSGREAEQSEVAGTETVPPTAQ